MLNRSQISARMILAISVAVVVGISILVGQTYLYTRDAMIEAEQGNTEVVGAFLAQQVSGALQSTQTTKIEPAFHALASQKPNLLGLQLHDPRGSTLQTIGTRVDDANFAAALKMHRLQLAGVEHSASVVGRVLIHSYRLLAPQSGQPLAHLHLWWDLETAYESAFDTLVVAAAHGVVVLLLIIMVMTASIRTMLVRPLIAITRVTKTMAENEGDLRQRIDYRQQDELAQLCVGVDRFIDKVHTLVREITEDNSALAESAEHAGQRAQETFSAIQNQRERLEQLATAANQMASTIDNVAHHSRETERSVSNAKAIADDGQLTLQQNQAVIAQLAEEVQHAAEVVAELSQDSQQIGSIVAVIKGIAEQTNLLALNAAIEAARAGEQGRGFAVVADEVRTLASKTQHSTEQIHAMISRIQHGTQKAAAAMQSGCAQAQLSVSQIQQAGTALMQITDAVNHILEMSNQIVEATSEQSKTTEEINREITLINDLCLASTNSAGNSAGLSSQISEKIAHTQETLQRFRV